MSSGDSYRVEIGCEAEGYPDAGQSRRAVVEVEFGRVEADHVRASTRLLIDGLAFEDWRIHYGCDILAFVDELDRMHRLTQGTARLTDWDGKAVLCLTVIDRPRGRVAVGGQLIPAVFWTAAVSEDGLLVPRLFGDAGGIRVAFEGLVTDQSYLPPVVAGLRRFLAETGIPVRNPMA
jgi:hypothetical protein